MKVDVWTLGLLGWIMIWGCTPVHAYQIEPTSLTPKDAHRIVQGAQQLFEESYERVRLYRRVRVYRKPNGKVLAIIRPRTEFNTPRTLGVIERKGRWFSATLPGFSRPVWLRQHWSMKWRKTAFSLNLDLSRKRLQLRHRGKVILQAPMAVGRPSSPTPRGRFSVTDKLPGSRYGSYYGCCILALSVNQHRLPPGWRGGNRVAIHGTNAPWSVGTASSAGCARLRDRPLRVLMRKVPLGTPVWIRA